MMNAIVTGGTSGIGLGVAKMLLCKGYRVFATYVGPEPEKIDDNYIPIYTDQTKREEVYKFLDEVKSQCDTINCIVCNAGITIRKPFAKTSDREWDNMLEVAVNSHYIIIRELYPLIPQGSRIIFTGSQTAVHPHATVLGYVNAVVPGFVETPWQKEKPEEIKQNIYRKTAIHRFATVDEVVDVYRFCIDNPFVNGSLIEVNGGYCYK